MADLLHEKGMISQKFTSFFTETFAGGTGSILGGIFLGDLQTLDLVAFSDSNDDTNQNSKSKYREQHLT